MQSSITPTAPAAASNADTGSIIMHSQSQPNGQVQMGLDLDSFLNKSDLAGDSASLLSLTVEEMESELASIENQRRLVMLARRLATAREEQAGGFLPVGTILKTMACRPRDPAALAVKSADSAREASSSKKEAKLSVPNISSYKEVFRNYKDIFQRCGESVDSLVDRINALEAQMPTQPEPARVHTLLFALPLSAQDIILKRQSHFTTRDELQKLAVKFEAFEAKQQHRRDRGGRHDGWSPQNNTKGASHAVSRVSKGRGKLPVMGAKGAPRHRERRSKDKGLSYIHCYNCERPGHYINSCPEPRRER